MSTTHILKCDPHQFDAVRSGVKTYEIRHDDRGFKVGDILHLKRTKFSGARMKENPLMCPLVYTGEELLVLVTHKLAGGYGMAEGVCVMSIRLMDDPCMVAQKSLKALAEAVWESRWVSDDPDYQNAVGMAAAIRSNNFDVANQFVHISKFEALKDSMAPVPQLKGAMPVVLFFKNDADRDEFMQMIKQVKTSFTELKL